MGDEFRALAFAGQPSVFVPRVDQDLDLEVSAAEVADAQSAVERALGEARVTLVETRAILEEGGLLGRRNDQVLDEMQNPENDASVIEALGIYYGAPGETGEWGLSAQQTVDTLLGVQARLARLAAQVESGNVRYAPDVDADAWGSLPPVVKELLSRVDRFGDANGRPTRREVNSHDLRFFDSFAREQQPSASSTLTGAGLKQSALDAAFITRR